jgi:hypothetical protein
MSYGVVHTLGLAVHTRTPLFSVQAAEYSLGMWSGTLGISGTSGASSGSSVPLALLLAYNLASYDMGSSLPTMQYLVQIYLQQHILLC